MFSRTGAKAMKADLRNTLAICAHLGNPQNKIKTIHIAGTNGKGSVSHMLAAIFQQNGYKTGLFTSPHLRDYRERIKVNGEMITKEFVTAFIQQNMEYAETVRPSFFELTFALAMEYFYVQKVDVAVIETGLGGRLDSTNVITPELSIITNIGYDHMDILGNTLEKIAGEKAGIIKEGVPVVIGETHSETWSVFVNKAKEMHASVTFADQTYEVHRSEVANGLLSLQVSDKFSGSVLEYSTDLTGIYQKKNLLTVLASVSLLQKKFHLNPELTQLALKNVCRLTAFEGRWQILHTGPLVVMDVGHNADGILQILAQLGTLTFEKLHFITGMVKDKDVHAVLSQLPGTATYYFTNAHIARALPADELRKKAESYELYGKAYDNVNDAILAALSNANENDLILICGSIFVVGEVEINRFQKVASEF